MKKIFTLIAIFTTLNINAQLTGNWDLISGVSQTTTASAVGLGTTTPNAIFNLVNPIFPYVDGGYYSHDPFHIQFSSLSTMMILTNNGMLGLKINNPNSFFI